MAWQHPPRRSRSNLATPSAGSASSPREVAVAKLNDDALPDLATADEGSNGVSVLLNDGTATSSSVGFAPPQFYATGAKSYGRPVT